MTERQLRLLPGSPESIVLVGTLAPVAASPGRTLLITSPVSERSFDEIDREGLQKFARLQPVPEAIVAMESIGGDLSDIDEWVKAGLLARFPGTFTVAEFLDLFSGLAVVWLTGGIALEVEGDDVLLAVPSGEGTVKVSSLLYAVFQRSDGDTDLPTLLRQSVADDLEALDELAAELIVKLRFLVNNGIAAVIRAR